MRFMRVCLLGVGIMTLAAGPAMSAVFTNRGDWEAALTSRQDISFNALATTTGFNVGPMGSGGDTVFFTPIGAPWMSVVPNSYGASCDVRCLFVDTATIEGGMLATLALATNTALGFNVFTTNATAQTVTVRIFNVGSTTTPDYTGNITTIASSSTTPVFFGYTGTAGIQRVEIVTLPGTGDVALDNFSYGITANEPPPPPIDTPEVPTLGYVGIGFLAVMLGSKKKFSL